MGLHGRTYRYFEGKPLFPFGYGLSYTTFSYRELRLPKKTINAGDPLIAEVTVANTGKCEGDEVVQLYLTFPNLPGAPRSHDHRAGQRCILGTSDRQMGSGVPETERRPERPALVF